MIIYENEHETWTKILKLQIMLCFRTQEGQTALQLAISNQLPLVVDAICTRGADTSVVDEKGDPPLWLALENGLEDIASTLVRTFFYLPIGSLNCDCLTFYYILKHLVFHIFVNKLWLWWLVMIIWPRLLFFFYYRLGQAWVWCNLLEFRSWRMPADSSPQSHRWEQRDPRLLPYTQVCKTSHFILFLSRDFIIKKKEHDGSSKIYFQYKTPTDWWCFIPVECCRDRHIFVGQNLEMS